MGTDDLVKTRPACAQADQHTTDLTEADQLMRTKGEPANRPVLHVVMNDR